MGKQPPLIRYSPLTGTWYLITRYTQKETHIVAHTGYKFDVTNQVEEIVGPLKVEIASLKDRLVGTIPITQAHSAAWEVVHQIQSRGMLVTEEDLRNGMNERLGGKA